MRRCRSLSVAALLFVIASIPSLLAQSSDVYSVFPQLAVGQGWSSDISVTNQDDISADVQLSLFTGQGLPLQAQTNLGTDSSFQFTVAAGATRIITLTSTGALQAGYALLFFPDDVSIRASLVVRWRLNGLVMTQLGVTQQFPFFHYSFPAELDPASQTNTGVALALPSEGLPSGQAQDVIVSLIDEAGQVKQRSVVRLVPGEHLAKMLNEAPLFPELTSFKGSVSVSCAQVFGLIALRLEQGALGTLTISRGPVIAPYLSSQSPTSEAEPNDLAAQGSNLTLPARAVGAIATPGDIDCFRFQGNKGDLITALTSTRSHGATTDTVLTLLKSDGQELVNNDQNGLMSGNDSFVQAVLPETGTYVLRVEDYFERGGTNFGYELHVSKQAGSSQLPAPILNSLSPSTAAAGSQNVNLTIAGSNLAGASDVVFTPQSGIAVNSIQSTAAQVTATLSIASGAATGVRQVAVTTPGGTSNTLSFTISAPPAGAPQITNLSPTSIAAGSQSVSLTISGSNLSGATAVVFSPSSGITVSNIVSVSFQVTAFITVSSGAATGVRQVAVTTPGGTSNSLPVTITGASTPQVAFIQPSSGRAGTTVNLEIAGQNLAGVTQVNVSPPDGITVSNIAASSITVTASLNIAAGATQVSRQISVSSPSGTSNSVAFAIAPPTTGVAPTISNLTVGAPQYSGGQVTIPIRFDFYDPDKDIIYVQGNYAGSAKLIFAKTGCTRSISSSVINKPGVTSGTFDIDYVITLGAVTGNFTINMQLEDAAGNRSNTLSFSIGVWSCELLPGDPPQGRTLLPGLEAAVLPRRPAAVHVQYVSSHVG